MPRSWLNVKLQVAIEEKIDNISPVAFGKYLITMIYLWIPHYMVMKPIKYLIS